MPPPGFRVADSSGITDDDWPMIGELRQGLQPDVSRRDKPGGSLTCRDVLTVAEIEALVGDGREGAVLAERAADAGLVTALRGKRRGSSFLFGRSPCRAIRPMPASLALPPGSSTLCSATGFLQGGDHMARANRLPAILKGEDQPADNSERLAFARMAYDGKRFAAAARHWALALAGDPNLDTNCWNHYRYSAACAAALSAAGQGQDEPLLDGAAKARLRRQALGWLKTELTAWKQASQIIEPHIQEQVGNTLAHWKEATDLASIRDPDAVAKLPGDELEACKKLWGDVAELLKKVEEKKP